VRFGSWNESHEVKKPQINKTPISMVWTGNLKNLVARTFMSGEMKANGNVHCEVCGNGDGGCFEVLLGGVSHIFDSFECAMHAMTPKCEFCGCQVVGHGIKDGSTFFCSYLCANLHTVREYEARVLLREQVYI
jgi:hypothetical protein